MFAVLAVISFIGLYELYRVVDGKGELLGMAGYLAAAVYYASCMWADRDADLEDHFVSRGSDDGVRVHFPEIPDGTVMSVLFRRVLRGGHAVLSVSDADVPEERRSLTVWLIFLSSWGCDTCAYCVGMLIGKHKMAPSLKPEEIRGGRRRRCRGRGASGCAVYGVVHEPWGGVQVDPAFTR